MLLHSYFAIHQVPLCGGVLASALPGTPYGPLTSCLSDCIYYADAMNPSNLPMSLPLLRSSNS